MSGFNPDATSEGAGSQSRLPFDTVQRRQTTSPANERYTRHDRPAADDPGVMHMVLLAKAIEHEIIPRLMLAHRNASECLEPPVLVTQRVTQADVQDFAKLVLSPDEHLAQACVEAMRQRGIPVETIYLDLLGPVARYLGDLWEQDLCDFTDVTAGLGRLQQVLRELSPAFGVSNDHPTNGLRALLLPSPGEQHTFGLVMVAEFFRRAGWDVAGGPWEAGADPIVMVRREWFDIVGFSLAGHLHLEELAQTIRNVRSSSVNPKLRVLVGGPVFNSNPEFADALHADLITTDGSKAPELAELLVGRPAAPPR